MMSSRCFLSRSNLACAESGDEPAEDWLGDEDPEGELSLLWGSLETTTELPQSNMLRRLQII